MRINYSKIFFAKIITFLLLVGFSADALSNANFTNSNYKQTPGASIVAMASTIRLEWIPLPGKSVMVIASSKVSDYSPNNQDLYFANETFGKGTAFGNGFVVYRGTGNKVKLSGLESGITYHFSIYEYDASGKYTPLNPQFYISEKKNETNNIPSQELLKTMAAEVVCAPVSGVTCTMSSNSSSSGYFVVPAPCNTGAFAGINPWDGGSCSGYVAFAFSAPISGAVIKMIAVNTISDFTTISATGGAGGALSLSNVTCMGVAGLVVGPYTGANPQGYGDVSVKVNSTGTYTKITCTNTGCGSGWVASCPTTITALGIELLSFNGECKSITSAELQWKTISEKDNDHFTIEKSKDAQTWQLVGIVQGAGTSLTVKDYSFTDKKSNSGITYYRLKQTDFDGSFQYYQTIVIDNCFTINETIDIFPNPSNGNFTLLLKEVNETTGIEIYNSHGDKVYEQKMSDNELIIDQSLTNGIYFLKIMQNNIFVSSQKLIIQN